jgi:NhaP-type Na+/H+ or K+/H+ antiporter
LAEALASTSDPVVEPELVKTIAEITLVWVLFADASKVRIREFREDLGTYVRLLGIGLPLTVALGTLAGIVVLGLDPWAGLLLGAALAPTDAALGASVMSNPRVPEKIRRALNVESGLNDGIATPIVMVAIAGVAASVGIEGVESPGRAGLALVVGALAGLAIGGLVLALIAYTGALLVNGNGFVAAFVGGLLFGATAGRKRREEVSFVDQSGALASMLSWLIFGAVALPVIGDWLNWTTFAYAILSLTIVRMLPVALVLAGVPGFGRFGTAFVGWFGPRGLASVIFALLTLEGLHSAGTEIVAVIALTVLLSVVVHGFSANPLANRFAPSQPPDPPHPEHTQISP